MGLDVLLGGYGADLVPKQRVEVESNGLPSSKDGDTYHLWAGYPGTASLPKPRWKPCRRAAEAPLIQMRPEERHGSWLDPGSGPGPVVGERRRSTQPLEISSGSDQGSVLRRLR